MNLNWDGTEVTSVDVAGFMDLNNGVLHRAVLDVLPNGADSTASMVILEDVHGNESESFLIQILEGPFPTTTTESSESQQPEEKYMITWG